MVCPTMKLVLFITALTSVFSQDYERQPSKRFRTRQHKAASIQYGYGQFGQVHAAIPGEDCPCCCSLDLSFLLDSSESVKLDNYEKEKRFTMGVVDRVQRHRLRKGTLSLRVALLQYSSHVQVEQTFTQWRDTANFNASVAPIKYMGHGTFTTYAINNMTDMYRRESPDREKIKVAILVTDGGDHPNNHPKAPSAINDARMSHSIRFFIVPITRSENEPTDSSPELPAHLHPRYIHNLQDENIADKVLKAITDLVDEECCRGPCPHGCPEPAKLECPCDKGAPGPKGVPGHPGRPGRPGDEGGPGLPGTKGEPGLNGHPGRGGGEGKPGYKGDQGEPGKCGIPGIKGDRGPDGPKGDIGPGGPQGFTGPLGDMGPRGDEGEKGDRGPAGPPGVQGVTGIGDQGPRGDKGFPGRHGPPGPKGIGDHGPPGPQGLEGVPGEKGSDGVGFPGPKGAQGPSGPKGLKGMAVPGIKGDKGEFGPLGFPGPPGLPGAGGFPGEKGMEGPWGPPGSKGDTSDKGDPGPKGDQGFPGEQGPQGETGKGEDGPKGDKGAAGLNGWSGLPGEDGEPGQKGLDGLPGFKGSDGQTVVGPPGVKGDPGPAGNPGLTGPPATPGLDGNKGDRGIEGRIGKTGLPGRSITGPKGDFGPPGPPGLKGEKGHGDKGPKGDLGHPGLTGFPGLRGEGFPGPVGPPGSPGFPGEPGAEVVGSPGPKGEIGFKGSIGSPGPAGKGLQGPPGNVGRPGPLGTTGPPGDDGHQGLNGLPGPPGGPGSRGVEGPPGAKGTRGLPGERGIRGVIGEPGNDGRRGDPGMNGDKGDPGLTIETIILLIIQICGCANSTCKQTPMELVFVIDSSESVGEENFKKIKDFLKRLVDRITIGSDATRIGLVLYSQEAHLKFKLDSYINKNDIQREIREMNYLGHGTYTGTAIKKATREAFARARNHIKKVAIVITDGQTDKREDDDLLTAVREAQGAPNYIEMYAVGIVNSSNPHKDKDTVNFIEELKLIASDPEHLHTIDDFEDNAFTELERRLLKQFCEKDRSVEESFRGVLPSDVLPKDLERKLLEVSRNIHRYGNGNNVYGNNGYGNNGYGNGNNGYATNQYDNKDATYPVPAPTRTDVHIRGDTYSRPISADRPPAQDEEDNEGDVLPKVPDPRCNLTLEQGSCRDYTVRWYYDKHANACAQFWYGGCGGNDNRFEAEDQCKNACIRSRTAL